MTKADMFPKGGKGAGTLNLRSSFAPHRRVVKTFARPSRTRQEFADECDINEIMKRYEKTGVVTHFNKSQPKYLDLADAPDFHAAMGLMVEAEAAFMRLPASVRKRFGNEASAFVEFAEKRENLDQMREWGLAPPEKAPDAPVKVEVTNAAPADDKPAGGAPKGS